MLDIDWLVVSSDWTLKSWSLAVSGFHWPLLLKLNLRRLDVDVYNVRAGHVVLLMQDQRRGFSFFGYHFNGLCELCQASLLAQLLFFVLESCVQYLFDLMLVDILARLWWTQELCQSLLQNWLLDLGGLGREGPWHRLKLLFDVVRVSVLGFGAQLVHEWLLMIVPFLTFLLRLWPLHLREICAEFNGLSRPPHLAFSFFQPDSKPWKPSAKLLVW